MAESVSGQILQIVPNDHPPFGNVCATYRLALESLGLDVRTLILTAPFAEPLPGATYLGLTELRDVRRAGRALREVLEDFSPLLAICHRYRAYRILRASGLAVPRVVTVAHEFGFFRRLQRRLERKLFAGNVLFAGVSPAVQAELGEVIADPLCLPNVAGRRVAFEAEAAWSGRRRCEALWRCRADRDVHGRAGGSAGGEEGSLRTGGGSGAGTGDRLAPSSESVRLLVVGDGPLRSALEARASGTAGDVLRIRSRALRTAAQRRSTCHAADLAGDVEAFGMVALEGMVGRRPGGVAGPAAGPPVRARQVRATTTLATGSGQRWPRIAARQ